MNTADIGHVLTALARLAEARLAVCGVEAHRFELDPPLTLAELEAFEARHSCRLPDDYRLFITRAGNGGAGPYYGLFPLGRMDDGFGFADWRENDGFVGVLSDPFPHIQPWNDVNGRPKHGSLSEDDFMRERDAFDKEYFDTHQVNGAIPICHLGCALRQWLIITGPEAGHVWDDERADYKGLRPLTTSTLERVRFGEWYLSWLEECLAELETLTPADLADTGNVIDRDTSDHTSEPPTSVTTRMQKTPFWRRLFKGA